ncbi:MAG: DUF4956 domain-containing protein [Oscillospiraceae bacterium]
MFDSVIGTEGLTAASALICTGASLALGFIAAVLYRFRNPAASKNMMISLVVLPILVQAVIMLVNGSIGAGIAVMGAFNLIRFRSAPGNSRDICYIFYAMGIGLATGMGYIGFAALIAAVVGLALMLLGFIPLFGKSSEARLLRVTIPENMDYSGCFDDIFAEYCTRAKLLQAKSTCMGTLFELRYEIIEKDSKREKEMLDKLRCRNGNLTISCGILPENKDEL